jgi:hypothetical protein
MMPTEFPGSPLPLWTEVLLGLVGFGLFILLLWSC